MDDLFIELVEHSTKDDGDSQPLKWVHIVVEYKNADDDGQYLSSRGDEGEDVLLEIGNDVVYTDLANHLKNSDSYYVPECIGVVCHKVEAFEEGPVDYGEEWADDKGEEIGGGEELIGGRFEGSFGVCLGIWEEGIHHHWYTQEEVAQPLFACVMTVSFVFPIFCEIEEQNSYCYNYCDEYFMFAQAEVGMMFFNSWEKCSNKYNKEKSDIPAKDLNGVWDVEKRGKGGDHIDGKEGSHYYLLLEGNRVGWLLSVYWEQWACDSAEEAADCDHGGGMAEFGRR